MLFWLLLVVTNGITTAAHGGTETPMTKAISAPVEQYPAVPAYVSKIGRRGSGAVDSPEIFIRTVNQQEADSVITSTLSKSLSESRQTVLKRDLSGSISGAIGITSCVTGFLLSTKATYTRYTLTPIPSHAQCLKVCTLLLEGHAVLTYTYNPTNSTCGCLISSTANGSDFAPYFDAALSNWLTCLIFPYNLIDPRAPPANCTSRLVAPLPDSALTASSSLGNGYMPKCAKIYSAPSDCTGWYGAWISNTVDASEYLQIDLLGQKMITGYTIMARSVNQAYNQFVVSFFVSYSTDGISYAVYAIQGTAKIFQGNRDAINAVHGIFPYPIAGVRYLRIQPHEYSVYKALRIEIHGCDGYYKN